MDWNSDPSNLAPDTSSLNVMKLRPQRQGTCWKEPSLQGGQLPGQGLSQGNALVSYDRTGSISSTFIPSLAPSASSINLGPMSPCDTTGTLLQWLLFQLEHVTVAASLPGGPPRANTLLINFTDASFHSPWAYKPSKCKSAKVSKWIKKWSYQKHSSDQKLFILWLLLMW